MAYSLCCGVPHCQPWSLWPCDWTHDGTTLAANQLISFQLCLMIDATVIGQWPSYIRNIITPLSTLLGRNRLRAAATGQFDIRRTKTAFGEWSPSVAGQHDWNALPTDISNIDNREALLSVAGQHDWNALPTDISNIDNREASPSVAGQHDWNALPTDISNIDNREASLSVAGQHDWNALPTDISNIDSREALKEALMTYYFKSAYDCFDLVRLFYYYLLLQW